MTDSVCSLFRNLPNIRFQGPIHEEITNSILRNYPTKQILFSDLKIKHFGYLDYIIQKKQKNKRNMKLIQTAIKNDPCNYYLQYGLGTEYFQTGDFQKALEIFESIINKVDEKDTYVSDFDFKIVFCLNETSQLEKARQYAHKGISLFPNFIDLHEIAGLIFFKNECFKEAHQVLTQGTTLSKKESIFRISSCSGTFRSHYLFGLAQERQGMWKQAIEQYTEALSISPEYKPAFGRWTTLSYYFYPDTSQWIEMFHTLFPTISLSNYLMLINETAKSIRPDLGLLFLKNSSFSHPINPTYLSVFLAQKGDYEAAKVILKKGYNDQPTIPTLLYLWAIHFFLHEEKEMHELLIIIKKLDNSYFTLCKSLLDKKPVEVIPNDMSDQLISVFLNLQIFEDPLLQLITQYPNSLHPNQFNGFRYAPPGFLKKCISTFDLPLPVLDYPTLIFICWASLKSSQYKYAYEALKIAKKMKPKRFEHVLGYSYLLNHSILRNYSVDIDSLLLSF